MMNKNYYEYFVWSPISAPISSLKLQAEAMAESIRESGNSCTVLSPANCGWRDMHKILKSPRSLVFWHFGSFDIMLIYSFFYYKNIIIVYHNITPWRFFWNSRPLVAAKSYLARVQLKLLSIKMRYIAVSEFNKKELLYLGKENVLQYPCFVRNCSKAAQKKSKFPSLFFNGRIVENKKIDILLNLVNKLQIHLNRRILFILKTDYNGKEDLKNKLRLELEKIQNNKNIRIIWLSDNLPDDEIDKIHKFSWVYVSASLHEGFGLPVIESIINETPALYIKCGGTESILSGAGCAENHDDLYQNMIKLIRDKEFYNATLYNQKKALIGTLDVYPILEHITRNTNWL